MAGSDCTLTRAVKPAAQVTKVLAPECSGPMVWRGERNLLQCPAVEVTNGLASRGP